MAIVDTFSREDPKPEDPLRGALRDQEVVSMVEFKGSLYVATSFEVFRKKSDDEVFTRVLFVPHPSE